MFRLFMAEDVKESYLSLGDANIYDSNISEIVQALNTEGATHSIKRIILCFNNLTDACVNDLLKLSKDIFIDVRHNNFSRDGIERLKAHFDTLEVGAECTFIR